MPVFFLGALISLIGGLIVSIGNVVLQVVRAIMPILSQVFDVIRLVVQRIGENAGRFFRFISGSVRALFRDVLRPIVDAARTYYERFKGFLQRVFGPVIKIFEAVNRFLTRIWDKIIGPILDALDKVRAALRVLAKLGVPWAGKFEELIQAIQREIFERFRQVQNWVNTATFWLDILLDPGGWIRFTPFLNTVYRTAGNILNIITRLADVGRKSEMENQVFRERNIPTGIERTVERVRAGEVRKSFAVQNAAARFRSRKSGSVFSA